MKPELKPYLVFFAGFLVVVVFVYAIQTGRGYHLQWSRVNGMWIWVDKDGKP